MHEGTKVRLLRYNRKNGFTAGRMEIVRSMHGTAKTDTKGVKTKMSKPRYYWFGIVKAMLYRYPDGLYIDTVKGAEAYICIRKALSETEQTRDGKDRIRLIEMVYFKKTHMVYGAAAVLHVSESTAKRWVSEFVYLVAGKMGYL